MRSLILSASSATAYLVRVRVAGRVSATSGVQYSLSEIALVAINVDSTKIGGEGCERPHSIANVQVRPHGSVGGFEEGVQGNFGMFICRCG